MGADSSKARDFTLVYFPIYGRGEPIRMLLEYEGVPFKE